MPNFSIETFRGRIGFVDPVLDEFVGPKYIQHYHVTLYPGCLALGEWARNAIKSADDSVLYVDIKNGREELLPESAFPADASGPYLMQENDILFKLDALPYRYEHPSATDCGLSPSPEFARDYEKLKADLNTRIGNGKGKMPYGRHGQLQKVCKGLMLDYVQMSEQTTHSTPKKSAEWQDSPIAKDISG